MGNVSQAQFRMAEISDCSSRKKCIFTEKEQITIKCFVHLNKLLPNTKAILQVSQLVRLMYKVGFITSQVLAGVSNSVQLFIASIHYYNKGR